MSIQWLAVQSFQHNQDLLAAINKLSIHLRLQLEEIEDAERAGEANKAREMLSSFFRELETLVNDTERGEGCAGTWGKPSFAPVGAEFCEGET